MKSTSWIVFALILSVRLSKAHTQSTAVAKTNSNFQYEQGHPDNLNTGSKSALRRTLKPFRSQVSAKVHFHMIYSFGQVVDVYYPRPVWGDTGRTEKSRALWSRGRFHSSWFTLDIFCQGCWRTSAALFFFFIFVYPGRVCWEHIPFLSLDWNSCSRKCASKLPKRL